MSNLEAKKALGNSGEVSSSWELSAAQMANQRIGHIPEGMDEVVQLGAVNRIIQDFIQEASYLREVAKFNPIYADKFVAKHNYKILEEIAGLDDYVYGISELPDKQLVTMKANGQLLLGTKSESGWCWQDIKAGVKTGWQFQCLPNYELAAISDDVNISILSLGRSANQVATVVANNCPIRCFTVLPNRQVISGNDDGSITISKKENGGWKQENIKFKIDKHVPITCIQAFPDGRLVVGTDSGALFVLKKEKQEWDAKLLEGHKEAVYCLQISKDGRIVTGSGDRTIRVWSNIDGQWQSEVLSGHKGAIFCLQVLPDNRIVSGSADYSIRIWTKGAERWGGRGLKGHTNSVFCLSVLPDGRIISGAADRKIIIWDGSPKVSDQSSAKISINP